MNVMFVLISSVLFFSQLNAQLMSHDEGLEFACTDMGGIFTKRAQPSQTAAKGDTCVMPFHAVHTANDEEAEEFCNLYAPWRLEKAERFEENGAEGTKCHVEATFVCDNGWIQMYGRCLQMPKKRKRFTYSEAEQVCAAAKPGAKIAFMSRKYIVGVWSRYFRNIAQIWVRASEAWDTYVIPVKGKSAGNGLALAFVGDSYDFSVSNNALIRVNPELKLEVLCEYIPPMTIAEINYIGRRYSEIYWPSVPVSNGILIRTGTHYLSDQKNMEVCKNALKPFMVTDFEQFLPSAEYLDVMSDHRPMMSFSHGLGYVFDNKHKMGNSKCAKIQEHYVIRMSKGVSDYDVKFRDADTSCENMRSTAIDHMKSPTVLRSMPDSRTAPMWCKVGRIKKYRPAPVPKDYWPYTRASGMVWVHKLVLDNKLWWKDAQAYCQAEGAELTGVDSYEELQALFDEVQRRGAGKDAMFIGGRRRDGCNFYGFKSGTTDACCRTLVMQWINNVATRPIEDRMWTEGWGGLLNPNYAGKEQDCLTLVGKYPAWMNTTAGGYLDDNHCNFKTNFICGKWVPMEEYE